MLHELDIEGYAVVDRLRMRLEPGLNVVTGETGSGKSILVGSLALVLGARASVDCVRSGARRARVSARFEAPSDPALLERLASSGIDVEDGELILERQVLASGKSRAYVNGSPVTLKVLRGLARHLGDIHGQHAQQTLLATTAQLRLLDAFAGCGPAAAAAASAFSRWREAERALAELRGDERDRLRRIDLLAFQVGEIQEVRPEVGEDDGLEREREVLANVRRLREGGFEAYGALYDGSPSASSLISGAASALESAGALDPRLAGYVDSLDQARSIVDDVAFELRSYLEGLEEDPARCEAVEQRLAELEKLKRKYGPQLSDVAEFAARVADELGQLRGSGARAEQLEREVAAARSDYEARAGELTRRRRAAAAELGERTERELGELALDKARFVIAVAGLPAPSAQGRDRVELRFSANPGQPLKPLGQVASGGELSRVALALKTALGGRAAGSHRRMLVFDEVDTGVGGRVAEAIGLRLLRLADANQVLCVTHVPQIACFGAAHFHVVKEEVGDRVSARVGELAEGQRVRELARMLSGAEVTPAALENARQMLGDGQDRA